MLIIYILFNLYISFSHILYSVSFVCLNNDTNTQTKQNLEAPFLLALHYVICLCDFNNVCLNKRSTTSLFIVLLPTTVDRHIIIIILQDNNILYFIILPLLLVSMDGMLYSPLSLREMCCRHIRHDVTSIDKEIKKPKVIKKLS